MHLETIDSPADVKKLSHDELVALAAEMRHALVTKASKVGGHLGSNLGVVELTIALHYVFECPEDKIVWDVSHQTYCHKMLTGRARAFLDENAYSSVTGYTNPAESPCDLFSIGHTSTSVGLALGLAKARDLKGASENVIAVIGDSALDGGQSFEALNCAGELGTGLIVVVNDNDMSIPENHGALRLSLNRLRDSNGNSSDNYFRALGFDYVFVRDGHDIDSVVNVLSGVKGTRKPVIVHVCTVKGRGYSFAEENREGWHWAKPFDMQTGQFHSNIPRENYGAIARDFLMGKIAADRDVVVVAASTPHCIGFNPAARARAGDQFIDVGIAEQDAVTLATGLARRGCKPVFATFASFYQRALDQIEQEMCLNHIPVTMIVTNASVYGQNDETHCGLYDIPFLANIRNLTYLAPTSKEEYLAMLEWSIDSRHGPVAIRVPWTRVTHSSYAPDSDYGPVRYKVTQEGGRVAILALGSFYSLGEEVSKLIASSTGAQPTLVNPRFITGIDETALDAIKRDHGIVITLEDGVLSGGFGSKIAQYYSADRMRVLNYGFSMDIPDLYNPAELMERNRLVPGLILEDVLKLEEEDA